MARAFRLSVAIPVFNALLDAVVVVITLLCVCHSPYANCSYTYRRRASPADSASAVLFRGGSFFLGAIGDTSSR
jgi:hypothetical protein